MLLVLLLTLAQVLPPVNVTTQTTPSPGFIYIAPHTKVANPPYAASLMVLNNNGTVAKSTFVPEYGFDFRLLPDGRLGYSLFQSAGSGKRASSAIYIVDTNLVTRDSLRGGNGYNIAMHSFMVLPNGNRLLIMQEDVVMDLTNVVEGGNPAAIVQQTLLQEVDIRGNIVFQWRALDHFPITVSYEDLTTPSIRYFQINSVELDSDGNLLLSAGHASLVAKINRATGAVIWILGGKLNQFTFSSAPGITDPPEFSYQHDIRQLPNGHITVFDNGTQRQNQWSRGAEYELDEVNKTCKLVWQYRHSPELYADVQGSLQTLASGHRLISWGSALQNNKTIVTEIDAERTVVFEAELPYMMFQYKAEKHDYPTGRVGASVLRDEILPTNTYKYTRGSDTVGLTVTYHTLVSFLYNTTTAQRFAWSPQDPSFVVLSADTTVDVFPPTTIHKCRLTLTQDGMVSHAGEFRFNADVLGVRDAQQIVVYYRDSIGIGPFRPMRTRYNPTSKELIVDTTWAGEFCFGSPLPGLPTSVLPPRLISPIAGRSIQTNRPITLQVSPQGFATGNNFVVQSAATSSIVYSASSGSDKSVCVPLAAGLYYWKASSSAKQNQVAQAVLSQESAIDSFVVEDPTVLVSSPSQRVTWWRDSSYVVRWKTNLVGKATIELIKNSNVVSVIADNVSASAGGYLWRIPVTVVIDTGYSLRVRSRDGEPIQASSTTEPLIEIRGEPTSVNNGEQASWLFIAPNPAASYFYVGGDQPIKSIQLFSATGEMVSSTDVRGTGQGISTEELPAGTYIVRIHANGGWFTRHLVVIK